jgi:broad specificity phosphatase PhoE
VGVAELILVRHGESTANVAREQALAAGSDVIDVDVRDADVPLTDLGVRQSTSLGRWLREHCGGDLPTAVWSSSYLRARQTAEHVLSGAQLRLPVRVDERLRDKELGVLEMLTASGIRNRYPDEAERRRRLGRFYYRAPGGESWCDVALRLRSALRDLDADEPEGRVLITAHDAVITMFRYICEQMDEREVLAMADSVVLVNAGVTWLRRHAQGWVTVEVNRAPQC